MLSLLVLSIVAFAAAQTNLVCCAQSDLAGNLSCISNTPSAICSPSNAQADTTQANCCKSKLFSCAQYFVFVNNDAVASTCNNYTDTDTDTDTTTKK